MTPLKSCPFCGGTASLWRETGAESEAAFLFYYVECERCGAKTRPVVITQYEIGNGREWDNAASAGAERLWNRRTGEE